MMSRMKQGFSVTVQELLDTRLKRSVPRKRCECCCSSALQGPFLSPPTERSSPFCQQQQHKGSEAETAPIPPLGALQVSGQLFAGSGTGTALSPSVGIWGQSTSRLGFFALFCSCHLLPLPRDFAFSRSHCSAPHPVPWLQPSTEETSYLGEKVLLQTWMRCPKSPNETG